MKVPASVVLVLACGLFGCVTSKKADTSLEAGKIVTGSMSYTIGQSGRPLVRFQLPSEYQPLPKGPMLDGYYRSFSNPLGSTIDVYLENVELKEACQVQPCRVARHSGWQKANPTEQVYPRGVLVVSDKFERRDIFANLPVRTGQAALSLKFVVKCIEGESCTDARDSILKSVKIVAQ